VESYLLRIISRKQPDGEQPDTGSGVSNGKKFRRSWKLIFRRKEKREAEPWRAFSCQGLITIEAGGA